MRKKDFLHWIYILSFSSSGGQKLFKSFISNIFLHVSSHTSPTHTHKRLHYISYLKSKLLTSTHGPTFIKFFRRTKVDYQIYFEIMSSDWMNAAGDSQSDLFLLQGHILKYYLRLNLLDYVNSVHQNFWETQRFIVISNPGPYLVKIILTLCSFKAFLLADTFRVANQRAWNGLTIYLKIIVIGSSPGISNFIRVIAQIVPSYFLYASSDQVTERCLPELMYTQNST